jgi:hypothetical protein
MMPPKRGDDFLRLFAVMPRGSGLRLEEPRRAERVGSRFIRYGLPIRY